MATHVRLPPLKALRVFEAAARTRSLTLAAQELHITHSAVSQQVKLLEAHFGQPLFVRGPRGVEATAQAKLFYEEVRASLDRIALAAEQFAQAGAVRSLRVSATPSFAVRWLLPRLSSFQIANPRIQVLISTSVEGLDELKEPFDLIIRRSPMNLRLHLRMISVVAFFCLLLAYANFLHAQYRQHVVHLHHARFHRDSLTIGTPMLSCGIRRLFRHFLMLAGAHRLAGCSIVNHFARGRGRRRTGTPHPSHREKAVGLVCDV